MDEKALNAANDCHQSYSAAHAALFSAALHYLGYCPADEVFPISIGKAESDDEGYCIFCGERCVVDAAEFSELKRLLRTSACAYSRAVAELSRAVDARRKELAGT